MTQDSASHDSASQDGADLPGIPLQAFKVDARDLDLATFQAQRGAAFLVLRSVDPRKIYPAMATHKDVRPTGQVENTADVTMRVLALVRKPESGSSSVSLGRTPGNDVVVADHSISKRHAFFKDEGTHWTVLDGRSRNGTFLEGMPVAAQGLGDPAPLQAGATVRLGTVTTTFLPAVEFVEVVKNMTRA